MRRDEIPITIHKVSEQKANRVAGLPDANRLQHSRVSQLFQYARHVELHRRFLSVRLDATNEPRIASAINDDKSFNGNVCVCGFSLLFLSIFFFFTEASRLNLGIIGLVSKHLLRHGI